jgi:acyl-CoA dehydrogenase
MARLAMIYPQAFSTARRSEAAEVYLSDPSIQRLVEFFEAKGLAALKQEDQREQWYQDWIDYQAQHQLYARLLSPAKYSKLGAEFDLLKLTRFLEVFAYFSPGHGYSLQVSFLGLFAILMGDNESLKREAIQTLEAGGLLAFGVSEKTHGADLLGSEFTVREIEPGKFIADGTKYYIGNSNSASMMAVLAKKDDGRAGKRAPFVLFALRPKVSTGLGNVRKIHTLGVRAGFVGAFEVKNHEFPAADLICQGRDAWDGIFGAVALGKFFLGFGSIGICEHALEEATAHLTSRLLYGKAVIEMPHLRSALARAYARLTAMKLYAYRALDYVHAATAADRRFLLFTAVQKSRVSTEGVKVMALLSECMGAKAFEADTYFEMALRDAQILPSVEGSTHINLNMAARFLQNYFARPGADLPELRSLTAAGNAAGENAYLMEARTGSLNSVLFPDFLRAYRPLRHVANVRKFARQARGFEMFLRAAHAAPGFSDDPELTLHLGQLLAMIVYAQLIAENSVCLAVPADVVNVVFHLLVEDLGSAALTLASFSKLSATGRILIRRLVVIPSTAGPQWDLMSQRATHHDAGR